MQVESSTTSNRNCGQRPFFSILKVELATWCLRRWRAVVVVKKKGDRFCSLLSVQWLWPGPRAPPVNRQYFETTWATAWTIIDLPLSWNLVTVHSIHVFLSNYWPGWYLVTVHSHPLLTLRRKKMIETFVKVENDASTNRNSKGCWSFLGTCRSCDQYKV